MAAARHKGVMCKLAALARSQKNPTGHPPGFFINCPFPVLSGWFFRLLAAFQALFTTSCKHGCEN